MKEVVTARGGEEPPSRIKKDRSRRGLGLLVVCRLRLLFSKVSIQAANLVGEIGFLNKHLITCIGLRDLRGSQTQLRLT